MPDTTPSPAAWVTMIGPDEFATLGEVGPSAWSVYLALRWYARDKASCYPSVETIGELIHAEPRAVRYALARLESAGVLHREIRRGKATIYHLLGTAKTCSTQDGGAATFGTQPLQLLVDTPATFGIQPLQESSPKVSHRKNTQEQHSGSKRRGEAAEIPEALRTEKFTTAWEQWKAYRREIKKALRPITERKQLDKLALLGEAKAIQVLDFAMEKGWTGFFEPKEEGARTNGVLRKSHTGPGQRHDPAADVERSF